MSVLPTNRADDDPGHIGDHNELAAGHNLDETHRGAAAPHSGHETPAGAQAKADTAKDTAIATGIPKTLVDGKGDLIAGTAADSVGRLGVGADGQVLTADAAETIGVKWAGVPHPNLAAHDALGLATQAELDTHAASPHGGSPTFQLNAASTAIIPVDNTDSFIVGSDRMDRDAADTTKDAKTFFNKVKSAFRAGNPGGTRWDDASVGSCSAAFGIRTLASGFGALAAGADNTASGLQSVAFGKDSIASGSESLAVGNGAKAQTQASVALGFEPTASGNMSIALGIYAKSPRRGQHSAGMSSSIQKTSLAAEGSSVNGAAKILSGEPLNSPIYTGTGTTVFSLEASKTYMVSIEILAKRTDVLGEVKGWRWEGVVARDSAAGRIVGTPTISVWGDTAADSWALAVSIDTTNHALILTATGQAGKTVMFGGSISLTELWA